MKFIMCRGLPGSGKSTWAQSQVNDTTIEVNRDEIRKELGISPSEWTIDDEWYVRKMRDERLRKGLKEGKNVISSDLNFNPRDETKFREMAKEFGAEFEIKLFDTPIEECIRRDALRARPVGAKEIRKMGEKWHPQT